MFALPKENLGKPGLGQGIVELWNVGLESILDAGYLLENELLTRYPVSGIPYLVFGSGRPGPSSAVALLPRMDGRFYSY